MLLNFVRHTCHRCHFLATSSPRRIYRIIFYLMNAIDYKYACAMLLILKFIWPRSANLLLSSVIVPTLFKKKSDLSFSPRSTLTTSSHYAYLSTVRPSSLTRQKSQGNFEPLLTKWLRTPRASSAVLCSSCVVFGPSRSPWVPGPCIHM